jgi:hypothetical protein
VSGAEVDVAVADFAGQAKGKKGNRLAPSNPELSLKRILDMFGTCLEHVWNMFGTCLEHISYVTHFGHFPVL